jgi:Na+-driven multidrug efflux pump
MIRFRFSKLGLEWESVKAVFRIGFPASLTQVLQPLGLAALMFITAQKFAELGTVAFSIAFRLEFFAYLPAIGFGFGSMAIIGQSIGAKNVTRANQTFKLALLYGSVSALVVGVLAMLFAGPLIAVFTSDPVVASDVQWYLYLTGATYVFLASSLVITNALQAVGHSWSGFWLVVLRYGIVTIPLTLYLTTFMTSMNAVWIALGIGNIVTALVGYIWVKRLFKRL